MNNLDTTTPMSEFNVVGADGTVTAVPVSSSEEIYFATAELIENEDGTPSIGENTINFATLHNGITNGTYKTAIIKLTELAGYTYLTLSKDVNPFNPDDTIYMFTGKITTNGDPTGIDIIPIDKPITVLISANSIEVSIDMNSGGEKLYRHVIAQGSKRFIIENNSPDVFTIITLNQYLYNNGFRNTYRTYPVQWSKRAGNRLYIGRGLYSESLNQDDIITYMASYTFLISDNTIEITEGFGTDSSTSNLIDDVFEL